MGRISGRGPLSIKSIDPLAIVQSSVCFFCLRYSSAACRRYNVATLAFALP